MFTLQNQYISMVFDDQKKQFISIENRINHDQILKKDGIIEFKTDNQDLFRYSLESIPEAGWTVDAHTFDLHNSEMAEGNVMTEYETKFCSEGKPICKLVASRKK